MKLGMKFLERASKKDFETLKVESRTDRMNNELIALMDKLPNAGRRK